MGEPKEGAEEALGRLQKEFWVMRLRGSLERCGKVEWGSRGGYGEVKEKFEKLRSEREVIGRKKGLRRLGREGGVKTRS